MQDIKIFILNGPAGVGKDTFVTYVDNCCRNQLNSKVISLSSVGGIKMIASTYFGYKEFVKSDKDRKFLADLKQLTDDYCDYSFIYVDEEINKLKEANKSGVYTQTAAVFIMCREPDKIFKFAEKYNAKTIFIDSTRDIHQVNNNAADKNVRNYEYDITIHNNKDLANLSKIAKSFMENEIFDDGRLKINSYE